LSPSRLSFDKINDTSTPASTESRITVPFAENEDPNLVDDDEWESCESGNEEGYSECEGSDSETDTTKSSKLHGNGVLHRSKLSSDKGNTLNLDLDDTLDPNHHLSILSSFIRRITKQPDFLAGWPKQLELGIDQRTWSGCHQRLNFEQLGSGLAPTDRDRAAQIGNAQIVQQIETIKSTIMRPAWRLCSCDI
jgi:hypothetical protein